MLPLQAMNQSVLIFANAIVKATTDAYSTATPKLNLLSLKLALHVIICHIINFLQCKATNERKMLVQG
jgi:heme/copper-type cytochrome/quinol oxidase subunit 1